MDLLYPVEGIRFQRELVGYVAQEGVCRFCRHRQFGRLPAELEPRPKIDVQTQALVLALRNEIGLSLGKIVSLFALGGLRITKGGLAGYVRHVENLAKEEAQLQMCWPHLLREAQRVAEIERTDQAAEFAEGLRALYRDAKEIAERKQAGLRLPGDFPGVLQRFQDLARCEDLELSAEVNRLQVRMLRFNVPLLRFVETPGLPATTIKPSGTYAHSCSSGARAPAHVATNG